MKARRCFLRDCENFTDGSFAALVRLEVRRWHGDSLEVALGEVAALQVEVPGAAELGRGEAAAAPGRGALQPQVEVRQGGEQPAPGHLTFTLLLSRHLATYPRCRPSRGD